MREDERAGGGPPAKVAAKGLIERWSGTSLRRNRLPTYMKPRFWPVYLGGLWVLSHAGDIVGVSSGAGVVLKIDIWETSKKRDPFCPVVQPATAQGEMPSDAERV